MNYKIEQEDIGKRLDVFLAEKDGGRSRSGWKKIVKIGGVEVNGVVAKASLKLQENDKVEILNKEDEFMIDNETNEVPDRAVESMHLQDPEVIYEDEDFVVVNKPAGMPTHRDNKYRSGTLVDFVVEKWPEVEEICDRFGGNSPQSRCVGVLLNKLGEQNVRAAGGGVNDRPGIVHRLDKDVSGAVVVARTQKGFDYLKKQFQERKVDKEYKALVHGKVELDEGEVNLPIVRSKEKGYFVARTNIDDVFALEDEGAKDALTIYKVEKRWINYTLLNVKILTGRTHQIRVHLRSIGHSIVGDKLYATRDIRKKVKKIELSRIWLHAWRLAFVDMSGEKREFTVDVSEELNLVLRVIK